MIELSNRVFQFFNKDFKKRFLISVSIPLLLSTIFYVDCFLLPSSKINDRISTTAIISLSQSAGGTSARKSKTVGFKYVTINNNHFSSMGRRIIDKDVILEISPIFKSVNTVIIADKKIDVSSGFNGINLILLVTCNFIILISICYTLIVKEISQNAKLNLVFMNVFMFLLWGFIKIKFDL